MNAKTLLDSRKFCLLATDFAKTWLDKKASEDDKEMRLEAVLELVNPAMLERSAVQRALDGRPQLFPVAKPPIPTVVTTYSFDDVAALRGENPVKVESVKVKRAYKRRPKPEAPDPQAATKAELLAAMRAPLSAEETATLVAESKKSAKTDDQIQGEVNRAVAEVVKANWDKTPLTEGERHFHVKSNRGGVNVSFEPERWKNALKLHGLPHSKVTFKPEGLAMSSPTSSGGGLDTTQGANIWRVMIG